MGKTPRDSAQSDRLRAARTGRGFKTAAEAISRYGWKTSTYMAHENGQNGISGPSAVEYGKAYGVDPGWLLTGHGKGLTEQGREFLGSASRAVAASAQREIIEVKGVELVRIPIYDIRVAAGFGSVNYHERPIDYFPIAVGLLRSMTDAPPEMIGILQVTGDSMYPTLKDRDLAFVDLTKKNLRRGGIYGLTLDGDDAIVKRAEQHLETGHVTLTSDNPIWKPQVIKQPDRLNVIGNVFWSLTRH